MILNISLKNRKRLLRKRQNELQQRVLTGKAKKVKKEEIVIQTLKYQEKRKKWEDQHMGGFERILPEEDNHENY